MKRVVELISNNIPAVIALTAIVAMAFGLVMWIVACEVRTRNFVEILRALPAVFRSLGFHHRRHRAEHRRRRHSPQRSPRRPGQPSGSADEPVHADDQDHDKPDHDDPDDQDEPDHDEPDDQDEPDDSGRSAA